ALAEHYPAIRVEPDVLYIDEGSVLTSAGTAAGIDLCLHIVRQEFGAEVANAIARRMVVPAHRDGGQAQYIEAAVPDSEDHNGISLTLDWAKLHLDEPITVEQLAKHGHISARTFARRFADATGTTPRQWLISQRLALAQRLLETTDLSIEQIAERCGFGSGSALREQFARHLRTRPLAYRRSFRQPTAS